METSPLSARADVKKAWDYAMAGGRVSHGRVIVEGFIDFDYEITQLTVRALGAGGQVETHFCAPIGHVQALKTHKCVTPRASPRTFSPSLEERMCCGCMMLQDTHKP